MKLINVSEAAILAIHAMMILASEPEKRISLKRLEKTLKVSGHHLSKVMQKLVRAGIINSTRGPAGGFIMKKKTDEVTVFDILEIIEGKYDDNDCFFKNPVCIDGKCAMGEIIHDLNSTIKDRFKTVPLSNFEGNTFFKLVD